MKYSTKFWLFILLMAVIKYFIWVFTGELTEFKGFILFMTCLCYLIFCLIETLERELRNHDNMKYFNIFWYPARGVVLLNNFLDKLQEYDERDKQK